MSAKTISAVAGLTLASSVIAQPSLTTTQVASGLNRPVFVTHAPGDTDRLFIVEKRGVIRILDLASGTVNATAFLNMDALVVNIFGGSDERGLLGLAFDPDYDTNGYFYVNYINNAGDTSVSRYTVSANPDIADSTSRFQHMVIDQPQGNHNGGWLGFGPDDLLYIAMGDGGGANDSHGTYGNAQDLTNNLLGKTLRIDPHGSNAGNYGIPANNPFVGITGDDEIWNWGLRNHWRNSFDRDTGDFWIADVGQGSWEEINRELDSNQGGVNYGWRCREGAHNFITGPAGSNCGVIPMTDPTFEYSHGGGNCTVVGGYVYRGCAIPGLEGYYIFGDYCVGQIRALSPPNYTTSTNLTGLSFGFGLTSFGEDAYGEVYLVHGTGTTSGQIRKIIPTTPPPDDNGNGIPDTCECLADWNGDTNVNTSDFIAYLNDYNAVLNGGTPTFGDPDLAPPFGVLNTSDFITFLNIYNLGC